MIFRKPRKPQNETDGKELKSSVNAPSQSSNDAHKNGQDAITGSTNASNEESTQTRPDDERFRESRKQAAQAQHFAANFGKIVSVLMRSRAHKFFSLADLEWLILPALSNKQFALAEAKNETGVPVAPVGLALWAHVSDDIDKRLSENLDDPIRLQPAEWKSGNNIWLIEVIGEARITKPLLKQLCQTTFKNSPVKFRQIEEGKRIVQVLQSE